MVLHNLNIQETQESLSRVNMCLCQDVFDTSQLSNQLCGGEQYSQVEAPIKSSTIYLLTLFRMDFLMYVKRMGGGKSSKMTLKS